MANASTVNIPAGANIQAAVDSNPAGTTFQLAPGIYRMQSVVAKDDDQFIGALDDAGHRLTTMSGAQSLTSFSVDAFGNYVAETTQTQPGQQNGFCSPGYSRCNMPEDFFCDNQPYTHSSVGGSALTAGQYFFDYPNGRIYFRPANSADQPDRHQIEYSRARSAILGGASNVVVRNLIVEKYAVPNQFGAIGDQYPGQGWVVQNNETRFNHGLGVRAAGNGRILDNYSHDNGQLGIGGDGRNILVQGNEIARNSYTGVDHNFERGGAKFSVTDGLVVRNNYSHNNVGPGMWTDLSSIRTLYENNLIMDNTEGGLVYETSYDGVIRNNTIFNNGSFLADDWFWNAQVQIASSQNVEVYGNVVLVNSENNGNGIMLIQQNRSGEPCNYGPCRIMNDFVHDNLIIVTGRRWHGSSGAVQDYWGQGDLFAPSSNNRFTGNQYYVTDLNSAAYWEWGGNYQTFNGFRSFGQDAAGSLNPSSFQ